jgi:alanyl-tRNA synthetase
MARVNCVVRGASASRRFAAVRLRRAAAKRFKKVENATAVIWKTLPIAEETFRRLDAPELLADLVSGGVYINGVRVVNRGDKRMRLATLARASAC